MKSILATVATVALTAASPALADPNWSGAFVGANIGYGNATTTVDLSHSTGAIFYNDPFNPSTGSLGSTGGLIGGLEAGYNHQFGSFVIGLSADVSWADSDASASFTTPLGSKWDIKSSLDMFGTVRARAGVLVTPAMLVYATGGMAWGKFDVDQATTFVDGKGKQIDVGGVTSGSFNHIGFVVGGGAQYALTSNWSIKAEYLYANLGSQDYQLEGTTKPGGNVPYVETFSATTDMHIGRVGLAYKF